MPRCCATLRCSRCCQSSISSAGRSPAQERLEAVESDRSRLRGLAFRDPVTGGPSRVAVTEALADLDERGTAVTVAYVDLDRFKAINDVFGHDVGDDALL